MLKVSSIQRMAILKSTRYFVPPSDLFFAKFPAQVYDPTLKLAGEVAKSHVNIFDDDSHLVDCLQAAAYLMKGSNVKGTDRASTSRCGF